MKMPSNCRNFKTSRVALLVGIVLWSALLLRSKSVDWTLPRVTKSSANRQLTDIELFNSYVYHRDRVQDRSVNCSEPLYIDEVFIAIKSTKYLHSKRIDVLLRTWISQATDSVYLVTDDDDPELSKRFNKGHYVKTSCGKSHSKPDLACKLQNMFNTYLKRKDRFKWYCSVDDDNYVVVPNMVKALSRLNCDKDWYIGKVGKNHKDMVREVKTKKDSRFWLASGGSGICLSKSLLNKMESKYGYTGLISASKELDATDDALLGYISNILFKVPLTVLPGMHSHIERLSTLDPRSLVHQITLSYGVLKERNIKEGIPNSLLIRDEMAQYNTSIDPTRFYTIHCYLYPKSSQCESIKKQMGNPVYRTPVSYSNFTTLRYLE